MNFSILPQETRGIMFGDAYYFLYTRRNTEAEQLNVPDGNETFTSKYFNSSNEIKVVTHGWMSAENVDWLQNIKDEFLNKSDFNVITIDWSELSKNPIYPWSAFSTRYVGKKTAKLLDAIANSYGVDGRSMHLIGHSLGSHVMGYTGLFSNQTINRITGLDPARPLFELPLMPPNCRLDKSDAEFVDIIHTCAGIYGYAKSHGHADFYANSGRPKQPGCEGIQPVLEGCSHGRSNLFFGESIDSKIPFTSYPCESWDKFENGECRVNPTNMGYPVSTDSRGDYYLHTNSEPEFARGEEF
ncbi:pancreatic triacylglycerol lipase [Spodoptera frugiperda]|uniref:Pancreatic triacylglycerol lipase n=1 Tax=Spodoptera frugiperda TaxID=7108 RepID=A0A9R0E9K8_SPOFR|nr:pancreatic triacylglycerol lipase [Spodoptera frugiperda]